MPVTRAIDSVMTSAPERLGHYLVDRPRPLEALFVLVQWKPATTTDAFGPVLADRSEARVAQCRQRAGAGHGIDDARGAAVWDERSVEQ